jgi:hypothetical protein
MQTIQLLGGLEGRTDFLRCAKRHLLADGIIAIALSELLELFDVDAGSPAPIPDVCEREGIVYCSQPTAVRSDAGGFVLERRRETVAIDGRRSVAQDLIHLDRLTAGELEREARAVGLSPAGRRRVAQTSDHVGSTVVLLHG